MSDTEISKLVQLPVLIEDGEGNLTIEKGSERLVLNRQEMRVLRQVIKVATEIGLLDWD